MIKKLKDLQPVIVYKNRQITYGIEILSFYDAYLSISTGRDYWQAGIITGIKKEKREGRNIFHLIDWARKPKNISRSSYGERILACTDTDNRGFYGKKEFKSIKNKKGYNKYYTWNQEDYLTPFVLCTTEKSIG